MATKRRSDPPVDPELRVDLTTAAEKITERITIGEEIVGRDVQTMPQLEDCKNRYYSWDSYNAELLNTLFTTSKFADEYSWWGVAGIGPKSIAEQLKRLKEDIRDKIHRLESIRNRLELIPLAAGVSKATAIATATRAHTNRVFVVHGHDEGARESVARLLEKLGIEAIVLHEQANAGRTIVEKLEHSADVDFAVVLLTPDDVGASKAGAPSDLQPRARQNVVLELGYFVGKLGRDRVCTLYRGPLELPSDFMGVLYVALDGGGAWRFQLAKELRSAGFVVDMNLV